MLTALKWSACPAFIMKYRTYTSVGCSSWHVTFQQVAFDRYTFDVIMQTSVHLLLYYITGKWLLRICTRLPNNYIELNEYFTCMSLLSAFPRRSGRRFCSFVHGALCVRFNAFDFEHFEIWWFLNMLIHVYLPLFLCANNRPHLPTLAPQFSINTNDMVKWVSFIIAFVLFMNKICVFLVERLHSFA
jgi:hypothetical protein